MSMLNVTIDGQTTQVPAGSAILDAANQLGIEIPTLCYLEMEEKFNQQAAACRICVVEVEGRRNLAPACATPAMEGMIIKTDSERVHAARKTVVDLMLPAGPLLPVRHRADLLRRPAQRLPTGRHQQVLQP